MEKTKKPFFIKLKNAIINFDEYKNFADEKLWTSFKYILKLMLIFTILITVSLTYKVIIEANKAIEEFKQECPEFSFEDNKLVIEGDNRIVKGDESGYFGLIIDSNEESLSNIEEAGDYERVIAFLKDKVVIRSSDNIEASNSYENLEQEYPEYNLSNLNRDKAMEFLSSKNISKIYAGISIISFIYLFVIYLVQVLFDILLLSIVGYLFSKIINIKLKYKSIFCISIYAITLPILLYMVYIIVNIFTGFTIKYFEIAYNAIAYIYIITAMLMMKSDLVKQQVEVGKIVEEQKKVREEKDKEEKREEKPKDKKPKEKEKKDKNEKKEEKGEEGSPA